MAEAESQQRVSDDPWIVSMNKSGGKKKPGSDAGFFLVQISSELRTAAADVATYTSVVFFSSMRVARARMAPCMP